MKKVVFIISHLCSGSDYLVNILNNNPRCSIFTSKNQYDHPDALNWLYDNHKLKNYSGSVYGDHLLFNYSFSCKVLYNYCKFIYVIRSPKQAISEILFKYNYEKTFMINYYKFRLRRISEMARKTKDSIIITYEKLMNLDNFDIIEDYLNLIDPLHHIETEEENKIYQNYFTKEELDSVQDCYEKYFYYLKSLENLKKII